MIALWDTTGTAVVKALAAERRSAGGVASGLALTLVAVVDEKRVREAEAAATIAAAAHPCRLLIVVRGTTSTQDAESRLDAEIVVGGRLGPCEAVVMRMHGRLALHAESVVMPLLAPDVPVVTWWHGDAAGAHRLRPARAWSPIAASPTSAQAERPDRGAAVSGPRTTRPATPTWPGPGPRRGARCSPARSTPTGRRSRRSRSHGAAERSDRGTARGWLASAARRHTGPRVGRQAIRTVRLELGQRRGIELLAPSGGTATLRRTGLPDRVLPLVRRPLGEELAEELRRLDADQPYAAALAAATGRTGLDDRAAPGCTSGTTRRWPSDR